MKWTQYGICSQAASKNARAIFLSKLGGVDNHFWSRSNISRDGCPNPHLTPLKLRVGYLLSALMEAPCHSSLFARTLPCCGPCMLKLCKIIAPSASIQLPPSPCLEPPSCQQPTSIHHKTIPWNLKFLDQARTGLCHFWIPLYLSGFDWNLYCCT